MSAELLLSRLQHVHKTGRGSWTAKCPAHHDKTPSLHITESETGLILLHDFAGCSAAEILAAIGMELGDLFPAPIKDPSPEARQRAREAFKRNGWRAALGVLSRECLVVLAAAGMLRQGHALTADDDARLTLAQQRIADARAVLL